MPDYTIDSAESTADEVYNHKVILKITESKTRQLHRVEFFSDHEAGKAAAKYQECLGHALKFNSDFSGAIDDANKIMSNDSDYFELKHTGGKAVAPLEPQKMEVPAPGPKKTTAEYVSEAEQLWRNDPNYPDKDGALATKLKQNLEIAVEGKNAAGINTAIQDLAVLHAKQTYIQSEAFRQVGHPYGGKNPATIANEASDKVVWAVQKACMQTGTPYRDLEFTLPNVEFIGRPSESFQLGAFGGNPKHAPYQEYTSQAPVSAPPNQPIKAQQQQSRFANSGKMAELQEQQIHKQSLMQEKLRQQRGQQGQMIEQTNHSPQQQYRSAAAEPKIAPVTAAKAPVIVEKGPAASQAPQTGLNTRSEQAPLASLSSQNSIPEPIRVPTNGITHEFASTMQAGDYRKQITSRLAEIAPGATVRATDDKGVTITGATSEQLAQARKGLTDGAGQAFNPKESTSSILRRPESDREAWRATQKENAQIVVKKPIPVVPKNPTILGELGTALNESGKSAGRVAMIGGAANVVKDVTQGNYTKAAVDSAPLAVGATGEVAALTGAEALAKKLGPVGVFVAAVTESGREVHESIKKGDNTIDTATHGADGFLKGGASLVGLGDTVKNVTDAYNHGVAGDGWHYAEGQSFGRDTAFYQAGEAGVKAVQALNESNNAAMNTQKSQENMEKKVGIGKDGKPNVTAFSDVNHFLNSNFTPNELKKMASTPSSNPEYAKHGLSQLQDPEFVRSLGDSVHGLSNEYKSGLSYKGPTSSTSASEKDAYDLMRNRGNFAKLDADSARTAFNDRGVAKVTTDFERYRSQVNNWIKNPQPAPATAQSGPAKTVVPEPASEIIAAKQTEPIPAKTSNIATEGGSAIQPDNIKLPLQVANPTTMEFAQPESQPATTTVQTVSLVQSKPPTPQGPAATATKAEVPISVKPKKQDAKLANKKPFPHSSDSIPHIPHHQDSPSSHNTEHKVETVSSQTNHESVAAQKKALSLNPFAIAKSIGHGISATTQTLFINEPHKIHESLKHLGDKLKGQNVSRPIDADNIQVPTVTNNGHNNIITR